MITMGMKDCRARQVHLSYSYSKIEIKGHFGITGPQVVGGEGGCPEWVAKALDENPHLQAIALVTETGGRVYQRLAKE